jgi:hypothetical protein
VTPRGSMVPLNAQAPVNGHHNENGGVSLSSIQQGVSSMNIANSLIGSTNNPTPSPQTPERRVEPPTSSVTQPVTINVSGANEFNGLSPLYPNAHDGLTPDRVHDGPMTPRNDAGPFVLDGSAGRAAGNRLRDASPGSDSASTHSGNGPAPQPNESSSSGAPTLPPVRFD